jgi:hypothetical protein
VYTIGVTGEASLVSSEAVVAVSRDGGATWEHHVVGPICDAEYQVLVQPINSGDFSWPMLAVDESTGRLAMAWEQRVLGSTQIYVTLSDDEGASWSAPVALGDADRGSFMPAIAAANGVVHLAYTSMNTQGEYDTRYRESADGAAWSDSVVISQGYACQCWSPLTSTYVHGQGLGHYHGLAATGGKIVSTWADNRDITGYQTIYARVGTYG